MTNDSQNVVTWQQLERELEHVQSLADERARAYQAALEINTGETQRRLEELNHAHSRERENWSKSLPRELFDAYIREQAAWREHVTKELVRIQASSDAKAVSNQRLIALIAVALAGLQLLLRFIGHP